MSKLTYQELNITEPEEGIIEFEVLPEHLKLLRGSYVAWKDTSNDWGAFQINADTPYGSKNIKRDMEYLLDLEPSTGTIYLKELHKGAAMALQIFLKTGKFKAAKYRATKYGQDWREYKPKAVKEKTSEETLFYTPDPN